MRGLSRTIAALWLGLPACGPSLSPSRPNEALPAAERLAFFAGWEEPRFELLPRQALAPAQGWPAYYWPSVLYGLLARPLGEAESPLEKFERVLAPELAAQNPFWRPGQLAALERQRIAGVSDAWFGICDGSAEAALSFPEPRTVKVVRGEAFAPHEIKGLLSYFLALSNTVRPLRFAGRRVDFTDAPRLDAAGRPVDARLRDVNPGLFHMALGNYVGRWRRGMVADYRTGAVVLNFPLVGYEVLSVRPGGDLGYDGGAARFVTVTTRVRFGESHRILEPLRGAVDPSFSVDYEYTLALAADGGITGGEWLGASRRNHPDFLFVSAAPPRLADLTTARLGENYAVGDAMAALLGAPDAWDSDARIAALTALPENARGYAMFSGPDAPPVPDDVAAALAGDGTGRRQ